MAIYVGNKRYALYVGSTRRKVMTEKVLPYDAEIEYLESTGTQYIDTGIYVHIGDIMTFETNMASNVSGENWICGWWTPTQGNISQLGTLNNRAWMGLNYNNKDTKNYVVGNDKHLLRYNVGGDCYVDDNFIGAFMSPYLLNVLEHSLVIFARIFYIRSYSFNCFNGKIYDFKLIINNIVERDFIPVRVGQIGYMYDKVSGTLFGNAGTGDFVLGPDKT